MDELDILESVRAEIQQILENYNYSYNITRGGITSLVKFGVEDVEAVKRYVYYAELIYGKALQHVEFLINLKSKK